MSNIFNKLCVMKKAKSILVLSLVLIFAMTSCDLFDELTDVTFDSDEVSAYFTVHPSDPGVYTFTEEYIESELRAQVEDNGGDFDQINEATIKEAYLEVISFGRNLDAFEWFEVYVGTETQPEKKIAWGSNSQTGATSVEFQVSSEDIQDILKDDEYYVRAIGELGMEIVEDIDLVIRLVYEVNVDAI